MMTLEALSCTLDMPEHRKVKLTDGQLIAAALWKIGEHLETISNRMPTTDHPLQGETFDTIADAIREGLSDLSTAISEKKGAD